jgi:hypothetical protein
MDKLDDGLQSSVCRGLEPVASCHDSNNMQLGPFVSLAFSTKYTVVDSVDSIARVVSHPRSV